MACRPCMARRQQAQKAASATVKHLTGGNAGAAAVSAGRTVKALGLGAVMMAQKAAGQDLNRLYPNLVSGKSKKTYSR